MKKSLILGICIILLNTICIFGQKNELKFHSNGEFKIVQITDTHLTMNVSKTVSKLVKDILEQERPDLVVITGDIIVQDSINKILKNLSSLFAEAKTNWVAVYGNHDEELSLSRKQLTELYRSMPYNLNASTAGIKGESNYILTISGKKSANEALLYFFDTNAYNPLKDKVKGRVDWIGHSQIGWYRDQSAAYTVKNGGTPLPALAFFHIPLPEYDNLWRKDSALCVGSKHQDVSCPPVNSGLYASMLECGDIMGTFVGHDHVNDFIGTYNQIALAYGRFSGTTNTSGNSTPGVRVIVLKEGSREFNTWIREAGGRMVYNCTYKKGSIQKNP